MPCEILRPKALVIPQLSAAAIAALNSPEKGTLYYDNTNDKLVFYNGSAWETITSA